MTTEEPTILTKTENGVLWITLNRPQAQNAVTPDQRDELVSLFEGASASLSTRCVVLTATGRGFCTGADLRVSRVPETEKIEGAPDRPMGQVARLIRTGAQKLIGSILDCEKPVIAAVNGTAAGIGAHLAMAADLVIAADTVRFIEVFVRRGITPDGGGAYLLPRLVGVHRAKELLFFGDDLSATDAERIGIVNKVVPADQLESAAREWAERLASSPTKAIGLTKWLVNRSMDSDRSAAFIDEAWAQELASTTADFKEGVAAFIERRSPEYKGW